jgi:hypothetical protein
MNLSKQFFKRAFRGKASVPYKIRVSGDRYRIAMEFTWHYAFFRGFMQRFGRDVKAETEELAGWEADAKAGPFLVKNVKPMLDRIVAQHRKKLPGLALMSVAVEKAAFRKDGNLIRMAVIVGGVCRHDSV